MGNSKNLKNAALTVLCLAAVLSMVIPVVGILEYDPRLDLNDDGKIGLKDVYPMQKAYGTTGTPITKASIEYDSGRIDITSKQGQNITVTHGLNITDWNSENIDVGIMGKTSPDGKLLRNLGFLTGHAHGWNKTYGGTYDENAEALVQTGDGGYALAGWTVSFGAGSVDAWLVKTDASGTMQWSKTYGGTDYDKASALVQTGDGGYALAGYTEAFSAGAGDFWLVKTDASGTVQWSKTYGGTYGDGAQALVQTGDGGYALAGWTYSFGAGSTDFWLVKTDAGGNVQWSKTYGGTSNDEAYGLVQTGDGGYALAGRTRSFGAGSRDFWLVKTDASGTVQWSKTYGGTDIDEAYGLVQTGDGGYALAGWTFSFGAGGFDFWLVKTDAGGNVQWSKTYGGTNYDRAYGLVQTSDGGYALAGSGFANIVKTDAYGNMQWAKSYGGSTNALVRTGDGGYALAGSTGSFGAGGSDFWLVKTDSAGNTGRIIIVVPDEYPTIQKAINAANGGDTIQVKSGIYYENVIVNKTVVLAGEERKAIVDGNGTGNVISVTANNVSVSGFVVQNSGGGLYSGICVSSNGSALEHNVVTSNGNGIHLVNSNNSVVSSNVVEGSRIGIWIEYSGNTVISSNNISLNDLAGIDLSYSGNNIVSFNNVSKNGHGIYLEHSGWTSYKRGEVVSNNTVLSNGIGIEVAISSRGLVSGNTVAKNGYGIYMVGTGTFTFCENNISYNTCGFLDDPWYETNHIYHNDFINNTKQTFIWKDLYIREAWDNGYPSGGNYWSNYTVADIKKGPDQDQLGSDGIGDYPYLLSEPNPYNFTDHYPLTKPYKSPPSSTFNLAIAATSGGTTDPAPGTYVYYCGQTVQIRALSIIGYVFYGWKLDDSNAGASNPINVTMNRNHTLLAVFLYPHDVAVMSVLGSKTVVGQGYSLNISVFAANQGANIEEFNVTVYGNFTSIASYVITLEGDTSVIVTFAWNTTEFAKGNYTISAYAWPVSGETDTVDNTLVDGWVFISIPGDINGDKIVDLKDVFAVGKAFGTTRQGPNPGGRVYVPNCDINDDDKIDLKDYFTTCKNYGKSW